MCYPRAGESRRGGQVRRWEDDFRLVVLEIWRRKSNDRRIWRALEVAHAEKQDQ